MSMEQPLKHMKDISDRLAAIGVPISEGDQVVTLLGSLPRSYATPVTALEAKVGDISMDFVQQALIHEEIKQAEISGQSSETKSALAEVPKRTKPREVPASFRWGVAGHIRRNCPKKKSKGHLNLRIKPRLPRIGRTNSKYLTMKAKTVMLVHLQLLLEV